MARITIVPSDNSVYIDGLVASDVNFSGIDPSIHAIQWYDTVGVVEFVADPLTGEKRPNLEITSIAPYQAYITQAERIINAALNPVVYYSTIDDNFVASEGRSFNTGEALTLYSYPPPSPPPNFTANAPTGLLGVGQDWYWYSNSFVASYVNPSLGFSDAKVQLTVELNSNAAAMVNNQLRTYSVMDVVTAPDPGLLIPADSAVNGFQTIQEYRDAVEAERSVVQAAIDSSLNLQGLFNISPALPEPVA